MSGNKFLFTVESVIVRMAFPSFVVAIYGMNFINQPEYDFRWGYEVVLGVVLLWFVLFSLYAKFVKSRT